MPVRFSKHIALAVLLCCFSCASTALARTPRPAGSAEARAAAAYDRAKAEGPLALDAFLRRMPKGADLHMHLSGAVYAETFIQNAAGDGLCVNTSSYSLEKPAHPGTCNSGAVPANDAFSNQALFDSMVDSFSMRAFVPRTGESGHDHFFATFGKFGGIDRTHLGEWMDEVAQRAAAQNEQYLEIMETPPFSHAVAAAEKTGWADDMPRLKAELLANGLRDDITTARAALDAGEAARTRLEHCDTSHPQPACAVKIRFLYQVLRAQPKERVFAQTLLACETIAADPRFVGLNFVQPEDAYLAMSDYTLQMKMLDFLHGQYPSEHIALHAGELAPGLVPPEGLRFHIRQAIQLGHAERIGHGVDVMYEDSPEDLLREMARRHVLVEINLTSNDVILGVAGAAHPFPLYRRFAVPVAFSTDDEGVSRIDLTHEFVRGALAYNLRYSDLKQMVRASLEYSFLPGTDLWLVAGRYDRRVAACRSPDSPVCADFLGKSEKAAAQVQLERAFAAFEGAY